MGDEKIDRGLPCGNRAVAASGPISYLGSFRAHKDNGKDEFHVHDDAKSLVFRMANILRFELSAKAFLNARHRFGDGESVLFQGSIGDPGNGRAACDLVFTRRRNSWDASLHNCGTFRASHVLRIEPPLVELYEFANGIADDSAQIGGIDFVRDSMASEIRATEGTLMFRMGSVKGGKDEVKGLRRFQLAIRRAIEDGLSYQENSVIVFPTDGAASGFEPADLAIMLRPSGWTLGMFKGDSCVGQACFGDGIVTMFDEIMQRP